MAKEKKISFLRNVAAESGNNQECRLQVPQDWDNSYPALAEYMSALVFPDGTPREPSTLTFVVEDGLLKGCVNDRTLQRSLWRSGATVEAVLEALEAALQHPESVWRRWRKDRSGGPRKN